MVHIEKKYVKLGAAALAVAALVIGLSVGLTQKSKAGNNASAAEANNADYVAADPSKVEEVCYPYRAKGGKSGGSKSGKSGRLTAGPPAPDVRRLAVPGTEEADGAGRRALRNEEARGTCVALLFHWHHF